MSEEMRAKARAVREELKPQQPTIDKLKAKVRAVSSQHIRRTDRIAVLRDDAKLAKLGAEVRDNATLVLDGGIRLREDGTIILKDAEVSADGSVLLPQGAKVDQSGQIEMVVAKGGRVPLLEEAEVPADGNIVTVPLLEGNEVAAALAKQPPQLPDGTIVTRRLDDGRLLTTLLGEQVQTDVNPGTDVRSVKFRVGNKEDGPDFRWVEEKTLFEARKPEEAFVLERIEYLNYYGTLKRIDAPDVEVPEEGTPLERLRAALEAVRKKYAAEVEPFMNRESELAAALDKEVKYDLIRVKYRRGKLLEQGTADDSPQVKTLDAELEKLGQREHELKETADGVTRQRAKREEALRQNVAVFADSIGQEKQIVLLDIVCPACPNQMGVGAKISHYGVKVWELLTDDPREANQDGGVFPAIFGTVLLVFLMAIICFPLGVLAGIYLGKYAKEGPLVRLVRVAVNNLAGIPSIVYGIFGLGFFIYICGGSLDALFFPAQADASEPVLGKGCILWASMTLGLLTIPVVIVSTEEALRAIPRGISEGSYALGATKFQTLCRLLVPMASPGMMTGFILAMARAAGEVAPLMITGAVKSAPIPASSDFPYIHVDQQFMHLGFHIFDISCKSPNVEATTPMVYVTTLLLLSIVVVMSSVAIFLRNRMRKRYQSSAI